jgi:SAM-dependent methyltransferase
MQLHATFAIEHGPIVLHGPFRGMTYPDAPSRSRSIYNLAARLLGSYEAELHGVIEGAIAEGYERIVDIGCGDGYYAVGLARRMPGCAVDAFDPDPEARELCRALAAANGVGDRVAVRSAATLAELGTLQGQTFMKMDCEGCELELLRPDESEFLRRSTILVELHEFRRPGMTEEVLARFPATHHVLVIDIQPRSVDNYPEAASLGASTAEFVLSEHRHGRVRWALLTPKG